MRLEPVTPGFGRSRRVALLPLVYVTSGVVTTEGVPEEAVTDIVCTMSPFKPGPMPANGTSTAVSMGPLTAPISFRVG